MTFPTEDSFNVPAIFKGSFIKNVAFAIMICFMVQRGLVLLTTRPTSNWCNSLLTSGYASFTGEWRPFECMTHLYSATDSRNCLREIASLSQEKTRLYFMGDTRLFVLFEAFAKHLNETWPTIWRPDSNATGNPVLLKHNSFTLCFLPVVDNSFDVVALLKFWKNVQLVDTPQGLNRSRLLQSHFQMNHECLRQIPTHLVLSFSTEFIKKSNQSDEGLTNYEWTLIALAESLATMTFKHVVWMLQDPVAEGLLQEENKPITNSRINAYNHVAQRVFQRVPSVKIWASNRLIAQRVGFPAVNWYCLDLKPRDDCAQVKDSQKLGSSCNQSFVCKEPPRLSDGFHVSQEAMYQNMQVLLNLFCNNHMKFEDGTCCRSAEPITETQRRCFILIGVCLLAYALCFLYDTFVRSRVSVCSVVSRKPHSKRTLGNGTSTSQLNLSKRNSTFMDLYELTSALSKFGLILVYCFMCDRTVLFMKANKGYSTYNFFLILGYILIVGLFFTEPTRQTRVNHVDITREWKGWMQVYFLVYHLTGSYRVGPLRVFARHFVSAYLFLSGFGHFHYMWNQRLPSSLLRHLIPFGTSWRDLLNTANAWWGMFHRYLQVIFRLNFFVCCLCLIMNRDYMFYHFMASVSFWFTVLMVMMLIAPRVSAVYEVSLSQPHNPISRQDSDPDRLSDPVDCTPSSPACLDTPRTPDGRFTFVSSSSPTSLVDSRGHVKTRSVDSGVNMDRVCGHSLKRSTTSGPPWTERVQRRSVPVDRLAESRESSEWPNCFVCRLRLADLAILVKLVLLFVGAELLARTPGMLPQVFFSGPQSVIVSNGTKSVVPFNEDLPREQQSWLHHWSMDRFSPIYGMLFALLCEWARRSGISHDRLLNETNSSSATPSPVCPSFHPFVNSPRDSVCSNEDAPSLPVFSTMPFEKLDAGYAALAKITFRQCVAIVLTGFGLAGIVLSIILAFRCQDQVYCTEIHAFLCLLPIISYILLRNSVAAFRRNVSVFFAAIGDISLELFIAQHHIWLSADGKGILVLVPGYPLVNMALTSFLFVCLCYEIRMVTQRLQRMLLPRRPLILFRNGFLCAVVLHLLTTSPLPSVE